jgi:hypothetical protein
LCAPRAAAVATDAADAAAVAGTLVLLVAMLQLRAAAGLQRITSTAIV